MHESETRIDVQACVHAYTRAQMHLFIDAYTMHKQAITRDEIEFITCKSKSEVEISFLGNSNLAIDLMGFPMEIRL